MVSNNNNNDSNIIVNLSHVLLSKIINYLEDNNDRIVFTFVCKRWFNERQGYLSFNIDTYSLIDDDQNFMYLNSYKSIISNKIKRKSACKAVFGDLESKQYYDYFLTEDQLDDIDRFKSLNIYKIDIAGKGFVIEPTQFESLCRLVSNLNVTVFNGIPSLKCKLPESLTSISFSREFNDELLPGFLPPNLKELTLDQYFNRTILAGVLPNTLVKLKFNVSFNQDLEPGVLPASLKVLKFRCQGFKRDFKVGSLPPNLEVLEYSGNNSPIGDGILPLSLHTLTYAPITWSKQFKSLINLKTLLFYTMGEESFDLSSLPESLTSLTLSVPETPVQLSGTMPLAIRHLDLDSSEFDADSVFKDRSKYQFDYLKVNPFNARLSLDGLKIKELELDLTTDQNEECKVNVPFGVESLIVLLNASEFQKIPTSVKKLKITNVWNSINTIQKNNDLSGAGSIQELEINYNDPFFTENDQESLQGDCIFITFLIIYHSMIVSLSHLLLSKIVNYLDNIDRIVFTLVCKRWFDDRDKYLSFNTDDINIINDNNVGVFTLKSYRSLILRSFNQKSNCVLSIGGTKKDYSLDPHLSNSLIHLLIINNIVTHGEDTINRISPNITTVYLTEKLGTKFTENLFGMISNSNVSTLKDISSLSNVLLPVNLTSITFAYVFDSPLLAGYLPPKLKKLKFESHSDFNQPISAGVLPNTLTKLIFGARFNQRLEPNVLPESLTFLELGGDYSHTLQVGSIPPNLKVFNHFGERICDISDGVLPQSLCTLKGSPLSWIPFIKSLNNLTTLSLYQNDIDDSYYTVDFADLPASLTDLDIQASCLLISSISPSIRNLDIASTQYDIDEIFKNRSQFNLERLCVDGSKLESLDKLKIKELQLDFDSSESIIRDIPFGVETVNFGYDTYKVDKTIPNGFPSSVKKFIFNSDKSISALGFKIPNTVEEVVIKLYCRDQFSTKWIPDSVKSLTVSSTVLRDVFNLPKSITNLCLTRNENIVELQVRKIYDNHYLIFGQSRINFNAAIVSRIRSYLPVDSLTFRKIKLESLEHLDHCDHISKIKSNLNNHLCLDNSNISNEINDIFINKRIKSIWSVLKDSSLHIQSLTSKESEISQHISELHEYLRVIEHKLKKSINDDIDTHNQQVNQLLNELKYLVDINNSNNIIINNKEYNVNNNNNSSSSNNEFEEIKPDITDEYLLSTIIKSINENSTLISFIENNKVVFDQQKQQQDHTSIIVNQHYNNNSDSWLLDSIYKYSKQFNPQRQLQIVQPLNIYTIRFNIQPFKSVIHKSISVTTPKRTKNTIFSLHRNGATLIHFISDDYFHTEEVEFPEGHILDFRNTTMSTALVGKNIYIFSGFNAGSSKLIKYNIKAKSFSVVENVKNLTRYYGVSLCYDGYDHIYLVGGYRGSCYDPTIESFNVHTKRLKIKEPSFKNFSKKVISVYHRRNGWIYTVPSDAPLVIAFNPVSMVSVEYRFNDLECAYSGCTDDDGNIYVLNHRKYFIRFNMDTKQFQRLESIEFHNEFLSMVYRKVSPSSTCSLAVIYSNVKYSIFNFGEHRVQRVSSVVKLFTSLKV
ncbi:hypothetical protein PPL_06548 [Heterostelium album PN500]|uniref:F-box domain-containing protein n=1 Tax=Heterostelium pallidum (strain ATCC 26659 / Pp 5 / PN500) TaxID=670386 RepID=D3BDG5_HETP5|nr:hypothetical protein PPL_06548 [Heterostelium album PN500]EFA80609.1 hypothetical protein PPL_06548 [Heterostelium album PN500]|eukprot:XP_020432729.1 hypothetical protein PPL_06548 [Heterostelium album PN500]